MDDMETGLTLDWARLGPWDRSTVAEAGQGYETLGGLATEPHYHQIRAGSRGGMGWEMYEYVVIRANKY